MTELQSLQEQVGRLIKRAARAEAQNKRMREALREIGEAKDASATWVQDIAKAALEEK